MTVRRLALGAAWGAAVVRLGSEVATRALAGDPRWDRTNHAGHRISLAEGPAIVAGCTAAAIGAPGAGLAGLVSGALGAVDDVAGTAARKGLGGHLRALGHGELTTGGLKVLGLPVVGAAAAWVLDARRGRRGVAILLGAGVIAGTANLINLFDLRPGRALKVTLVLAACMAPGGDLGEGVLVGTCLAALPADLAARQMMGDTGANALGALAGALMVDRLGTGGRAGVLGVLVAMTLASERVSFSQVIARHPVLRRVDEWGRATQ